MSLAAIVLLLIVMTVAGVASEHTCAHDTPELQRTIREELRRSPRLYLPRRRQMHGAQVSESAPLRIVASFADLTTAGRFCSAAGDVRPDFNGGTVRCAAEDVLTADKRAALQDVILPRAIQQLASALSVDPVDAPIRVPAGSCNEFTVPSSHHDGVADADYVLYVGAGPAAESTLAWAGACRLDDAGRPVIGRANFNPRHLSLDGPNTAATEEKVRTAVHELIHALGFSESVFHAYVDNATVRGKPARVLRRVPSALAAARDFLGCAALDFVELEDEGGPGSAGSHLERRVFRDELMTAAGGSALSAITLGVLADVAGYHVNPSAAQPMSFGAAAGCQFAQFTCNTTGGGRGRWWCFDTDSSRTACTADGTGVGFCDVQQSAATVPERYQYFADPSLTGAAFSDGCPVVRPYSNHMCTQARGQTSDDVVLGETYSAQSRCVETDGLLRDGYAVSGLPVHRCLAARCTTTGRLIITVGDSASRVCTSRGERLSGFAGFAGSVICPDPLVLCPPAPVTPAPPATPAPVVNGTIAPPPTFEVAATPRPTAATEWIARLRGRATLSGRAFATMPAEGRQRVADGLAHDIARTFSLTSTLVRGAALQVSEGTGDFRFEFGNVPLTADDADVGLANMVAAGGVVSNAAAAYRQASPSATDEPRMTSASVERESVGLCSDVGNIPADMCLVYIGVGIVAFGVVVCVVCVIVRTVIKRNEPPPPPNMVMVGPSDLDVPTRKRRARYAAGRK